MRNILETYKLPTGSAAAAVAAVRDLEDEALTSLVADATGGQVVADTNTLVTAAQHAVNAIMTLGENATTEKVAAHVTKRIALVEAPSPAPVEATPVETVVAEAGDYTATEVAAPDVTALAVTVAVPAKRGRGRPKLAETALDRAARIIADAKAAGTVDPTALKALLVANGIKESSANVYLWRLRGGKDGTRAAKSSATAAE